MIARLIWDNKTCRLTVPPEMGAPAHHQMQGSPWDQLVELAGRVCYDSLGKGRDSVAYHQHIREAGHLSVLEHATFTVCVPGGFDAESFLNRPALWVRRDESGDWRVTLNFRHVTEWADWTPHDPDGWTDLRLGTLFHEVTHKLAKYAAGPRRTYTPTGIPAWYVPPETPEEHWLTFYIGGVSRGLTHELVRHGDYTAISQRSTRYCDESESDYAWHPKIREMCRDAMSVSGDDADSEAACLLADAESAAKLAYLATVERLIARGADRKTARGAARGVLGNALATELIFSASLAQWRRIIKQRASVHADDEIRLLMDSVEAQIDAVA